MSQVTVTESGMWDPKKTIIKLSNYGDPSRVLSYDSTGALYSKEDLSYSYDAKHNWIKRAYKYVTYDKGKIDKMKNYSEIREITYW